MRKPQKSSKGWDSRVMEKNKMRHGNGIKMMFGKSLPEDGLCKGVMPNSSVFLTDWDTFVKSDLAIFKSISHRT